MFDRRKQRANMPVSVYEKLLMDLSLQLIESLSSTQGFLWLSDSISKGEKQHLCIKEKGESFISFDHYVKLKNSGTLVDSEFFPTQII